MNEETQAQQFTQDIDNILHHASGIAYEDRPETYHRELDVVQALVAADFSPESRVRQSLKWNLLNPPAGEKEHLMNKPIYRRSFVRLAVAGLLIALLLLAISPYGELMGQFLFRIVDSWQLGENTTAVSIEGDFEAIQAEDGSTIIQPAPETTDIEEEEPSRPEAEAEAEEQRHITFDPTIPFEQAQEYVSFTLRQPTFVPEGYEMLGVVMINAGQASIDYFNESETRLLGLLQTAVGGENGGVQVSFSSDMIVEERQINGHDALWTLAGDEGLLVWEADGVNYQLMGLSDLELALRVAESIQ